MDGALPASACSCGDADQGHELFGDWKTFAKGCVDEIEEVIFWYRMLGDVLPRCRSSHTRTTSV